MTLPPYAPGTKESREWNKQQAAKFHEVAPANESRGNKALGFVLSAVGGAVLCIVIAVVTLLIEKAVGG